MTIDVLVTSSSRFEHFRRTVKSFLEKIDNPDGYRLHLHEDVKDSEESEKILHWSQGVFYTVLSSNPAIGRAEAFKKLFKESLPISTYFFYLEQDWEFIKEFDPRVLVQFIRRNIKINQVTFQTERQSISPNWEFKEFEGIQFCRSKYWHMSPSLWRRSFVNKHLDAFISPDSRYNFQTTLIKTYGKFNYGSYVLGKTNEYVIHLGPEGVTPLIWL